MPDELIEKELRYKLKEGFSLEDYENARRYYIYSDLPMSLRVKRFDFMHDAEVIEKIKQRVELCREYIQTLIDAIK